MATRTTKPTKPTASTEPAVCQPCGGTGNVPTTVRVGRKRRPVGQQDGLCLNCFGSGTDPNT
ncbi:hypothetical protein ABZ571_10345 [Streptomyces sp. NPDC013130]|uniref:hypothetical protein n=1 Tax=Streptomyces sp. NPDC013130 TaxID=3156695 RepID=UPI0033C58E14